MCGYFIEKYSLAAEVTAEVCARLLEFTSGQLFPFVTFVQHILNPNNEVDLSKIDNYLSGKELRTSTACMQVRQRCFPFLISPSRTKVENLLLRKKGCNDLETMAKLGVWGRGSFILTSEVFLNFCIPRSPDEISLDEIR